MLRGGLVVQNCVCRSTTTDLFSSAHAAVLLGGGFCQEKHSSPSEATISDPISASLRILPCKEDPSRMKLNVAGVRSYPSNCVITWMTVHFLSKKLGVAMYPISIECTNLMVTGYLDMQLDLAALHRHPKIARASLYVPDLISCLRLRLKTDSRMNLSIFPAGTMVMTGPPSLAVAYTILEDWLPIIRQFGTVPSDPQEHRRKQVAEQHQFVEDMTQRHQEQREQPAKTHTAKKGVVHPTPLIRRSRSSAVP